MCGFILCYHIDIEKGTVLHRYKVIKKIGEGGFGDVYMAEDEYSGKKYALKTEYINSKRVALDFEVDILRNTKSKYIPKVYYAGVTPEYRYFVLDLLGANLLQIQGNKAIPLDLALVIAEETLNIVTDLHRKGILHRDIKPENFMMRLDYKNDAPLCLIDFGLAKRHIDPKTKNPFPPQQSNSFVGSFKYASPNSFNKRDLGRCDDLYSWFIMIVDLILNELPWDISMSKHDAKAIKETIDPKVLCKDLPQQFITIYNVIMSYSYETTPDYDELANYLEQIRKEENINLAGDEWDRIVSLNKVALKAAKKGDNDDPSPQCNCSVS